MAYKVFENGESVFIVHSKAFNTPSHKFKQTLAREYRKKGSRTHHITYVSNVMSRAYKNIQQNK